MRQICLPLLSGLLLSSLASAKSNVIYGEDNRRDVYEVTNPLYVKLAQSTAAMIPLGKFASTPDKTIFDFASRSLERSQNVCSTESFSQQPTGATCSGFLVSQNVLVTAGHCFKSFSTPQSVCDNFAWVFDYSMGSANDEANKNIPAKNIYLCKEVIEATLDSQLDYAIIKLDRSVVGRSPLKFRTQGKIAPSTPLVVIGHPSGLPTKISDGGKVTSNVRPTQFSTNLDTFHGNSGSAVFDAKTGQIEGILIQGKTDYVPSVMGDDQSCRVVNTCDNNGNNCRFGEEFGSIAFGEVVLRIEAIADKLKSAMQR